MKCDPNPKLTIDIRPIGLSGEPLLVIDDFLAEPEALVAAAAAAEWKELPPGGYPGRRAGLPRDYARAVLRRLHAPICEKLLKTPAELEHFDCSFSMVTREPKELAPLQRIPHIDIARENRVAILHYLCDERFGGTAFFRQSSTGLEQIAPQDRARYLEARRLDLAKLGASPAFPGADTAGYEQSSSVKARFNRLVAYRSFTLHSGVIDSPEMLSSDPAKGRLTANFFVDYTLPDA